MLPAKFSKVLAIAGALALVTASLTSMPAQAAATSAPLKVLGARVGSKPFIGVVRIGAVDQSQVASVSFEVQPREGTVSAAVSATYSIKYLQRQHLLRPAHHSVLVPVYGLYDGFTNHITIKVTSPKRVVRQTIVTLTTPVWVAADSPQYNAHQVVVARDPNVKLQYSFFMLKATKAGGHPVVMDTDGYVRWVGTGGNGQQGSTFVGNNFYLGGGSSLNRIGLDGRVTHLVNLKSLGYTNFHHNIDPGRDGLLLELNRKVGTNSNVGSDILEVDLNGKILRSFDLGKIISDAMIAGGDDPSNFARLNVSYDWFHNNAATYWAAQNELVVSSRENFVMGIDYDTQAIKWILGDPTKAWHQYASLAAYALTVPDGGHYPIGQHAVSFTADGKLMLFDNGFASMQQTPAGASRQVSEPRQYALDLVARTATETWSFSHTPDVFSPICSSIYQSGASYLIDYASENWGNLRLVGIDQNKNIAFEYFMPGAKWSHGWNALPIHIEAISYK